MNLVELRKQKDDLEKMLRDTDKDDEKEIIQKQINFLENQIRNIEKEEYNKTLGGKIGSFVGAAIGGTVSFVTAEIEATTTGKTDEEDVRRNRAKVVASGRKIGATIGTLVEKGIRTINDNRKGSK